jgi:clan AA aspartic protease (TIGR02281 family)
MTLQDLKRLAGRQRGRAGPGAIRRIVDHLPLRTATHAFRVSLLAVACAGGQPVTAQGDMYAPQQPDGRYPPTLSYGNDLLARPPAARRVAYSSGPIAGEAQTMRIRRDPNGSFVANVLMNGVPVRVIIDTGAQCTILSLQDARQTGADRDITRSATMAGIGGYTQLNVTRVRSMNVGGQQFGGFTAVIGQAGIPYTLLGQTEISRLGRIVIEDGVMTISAR